MARPHDDRGAVAVMVAGMLTVLVALAAYTVDLGMQRNVRRDLQSLSDVVALDLARELDGRTQAQLAGAASQSNPTSALSRSLARNPDNLGEHLAVQVSWGAWNGTTFDTTANPPTAVRVVASADVDFAFAAGRGAATRTAIASAASTACHRLGSFAAAVRSGDSAVLGPLNDLMGLNLSLVSYQGLANVDVTLAQLAASTRIGSVSQLLTGSVRYADLVQAAIDVLNAERPAGYAAAVTTLRTVLGAAGTVPDVRLGDVFHVAPSDTAALAAGLSVLDVLGAAVLAADGQHALSVPNLQAGVPGVGNQFTGSIFIVEAPALACGRPNQPESSADAAQVRGDMGVNFINLPSLGINDGTGLNLLKGTLQTSKGVGTIHVNLGNAHSQLIDPPQVHCGDETPADPTTFSVTVSSGLASYELVADLQVTGTIKLGTGPAKVDVDVDDTFRLTLSAPSGGGGSTVNLSLPPNDVTPGDDRVAGEPAGQPHRDRGEHLGQGRRCPGRPRPGQHPQPADPGRVDDRQQQLQGQDARPVRAEPRQPAGRARRQAGRRPRRGSRRVRRRRRVRLARAPVVTCSIPGGLDLRTNVP